MGRRVSSSEPYKQELTRLSGEGDSQSKGSCSPPYRQRWKRCPPPRKKDNSVLKKKKKRRQALHSPSQVGGHEDWFLGLRGLGQTSSKTWQDHLPSRDTPTVTTKVRKG